MATAKNKNLEIELKNLAEYFAEQMRINLGAKVKRKTYRSNWKNGKPYNTRVKTIRANHIASGNLLRSIEVVQSNKGYAVEMAEYGEYVNSGRDKGKGIPVSKMETWSKQKMLRPRNLRTGAFIKNSKNNRSAMNFLMNRKIKHFGIEAFPFVKMSRETSIYMFDSKIKGAVKKDMYNNLGIIFRSSDYVN